MIEKGQTSNGVSERILMCGNEALGEAAIVMATGGWSVYSRKLYLKPCMNEAVRLF